MKTVKLGAINSTYSSKETTMNIGVKHVLLSLEISEIYFLFHRSNTRTDTILIATIKQQILPKVQGTRFVFHKRHKNIIS